MCNSNIHLQNDIYKPIQYQRNKQAENSKLLAINNLY